MDSWKAVGFSGKPEHIQLCFWDGCDWSPLDPGEVTVRFRGAVIPLQSLAFYVPEKGTDREEGNEAEAEVRPNVGPELGANPGGSP